MNSADIMNGLIAIGMGLAIGGGAIGAGIGQGNALRGALEGMARNPEMTGTLRTNMFIAAGLTETQSLYGLLVVFVLLAQMA